MEIFIVGVSYQNIIGLQIVEKVAAIMYGLEFVQKLDADLNGSIFSKSVGIQFLVLLKGFAQTLLYYI